MDDYNISCYGDDHKPYIAAAACFLMLYIVGVPFSIFTALWRTRRHHHDQSSKRYQQVRFQLGSLFQQYEPRYWWFELVIIATKMAMTGGLSVVAPGTPVQMLCSIFVMIGYLLIIVRTRPYLRDIDDTMSFISTLALCVTLILGLTMAMDEKNFFDKEQMGVLLVAMNCCVLALQLSNIVIIKCKAVERVTVLARTLSGKQWQRGSGTGTRKVVPLEKFGIEKEMGGNEQEIRAKKAWDA